MQLLYCLPNSITHSHSMSRHGIQVQRSCETATQNMKRDCGLWIDVERRKLWRQDACCVSVLPMHVYLEGHVHTISPILTHP
jgi:hypothetical protein